MMDQLDIMIVEDSPTQAAQFKYILNAQGYSVVVAVNGREGITAARELQPSLIISDIVMPELDGCEMIDALKQEPLLRGIPIMLVSSLSNPEVVVRAINAGADYYMIKPYDETFFLSSVKAILEAPARERASETLKEFELFIEGKKYSVKSHHEQILTLFFSIYQNTLEQNRQLRKAQAELQELNDNLEGLVRKKTEELTSSFIGSTEAISELLEGRDPYTAGHARGVTKLAVSIAKRMGMSVDEIEGLRVCGMLHDLGKVVISSGILSKPGKLSDHEFGIIRQHPETAFQALHRIPFPWPVAEVVSQHHERLDGKGYPHGLKGAEIHPWARILAVADVVDAMITHRPYRPALSKKIVIEELNRGRGSAYDSRVVDECKAVMQQEYNRVMVVDDERALVDIMMRFLKNMDLDCEGYVDPHTALEAFRKKPFPLLITDINMPGMSGLELLTEVHKINPGCSAIIVTGYGEKENIVEAMRLGASDFLEKPLEIEGFRSAVKRQLTMLS
ncbi:MAG: response regulator [Deltaproteobacteria bacterium]|nr:response regulator [Deltaproteobacteria bacterium]